MGGRGRRCHGLVIDRRDGAAQRSEHSPHDPRDLQLRDADTLADFGLREVLLEAQAQHLARAESTVIRRSSVPVAVKCGSIESGPPRTPIVRVWAGAEVINAVAQNKPMANERIAFS